ncbi:MAG: tRNA-dihydrouridine synthase [Lachnospiraceae bacterium]|nr:tRNA-dihydrouridine synthase [Lachnospiraceae bacterium]
MEIKPLRIGNLLLPSNILMAPLAGYTCLPFRILVSELGAGLNFTEMASANSLKYHDLATRKLLLTDKRSGKVKAAQLLGGNPAIMETVACSKDMEKFDIIDINMGCPVPNVFKAGEGCAMMLDMPRASAVIRAVKKSGKVVTVKCRTGIKENDMFAAEFARMCEDAGADMITIHGRSRSMMYDGVPHYEEIAQAKAAVSIPVIANGGINSALDAKRVMEQTGADGVMFARYALENPFVIRDLTGTFYNKSLLEVMLEQLSLALEYYDETFALQYVRRIAANGMKKRRGTKKYKEGLYRAGSVAEIKELLCLIFGEGEP